MSILKEHLEGSDGEGCCYRNKGTVSEVGPRMLSPSGGERGGDEGEVGGKSIVREKVVGIYQRQPSSEATWWHNSTVRIPGQKKRMNLTVNKIKQYC